MSRVAKYPIQNFIPVSHDLTRPVFITLPKKPKALECSDFRTISFMSHVMKALLNIILDCNEKKLKAEISENQSGFRPGKGTREGILNLQVNFTKLPRSVKAYLYMFHRLWESI